MELKVAAHTTEIGGSLDPERQAHDRVVDAIMVPRLPRRGSGHPGGMGVGDLAASGAPSAGASRRGPVPPLRGLRSGETLI